jgi:hypothetical protein
MTGTTARSDGLPSFWTAVHSVPLFWGPLAGAIIAACLVTGGLLVNVPLAEIRLSEALRYFGIICVSGAAAGLLSCYLFGLPSALWMRAKGLTSFTAFIAVGAGGGLIALFVWWLLMQAGLIFDPVFAQWMLAFPIYGTVYAALFRWRAGVGR